NEGIRTVVAKRSDHTQRATGQQLLTREGNILFVDTQRELGKAVAQVIAEIEKLELFGAFPAARHLAQVVHLPLGWCLPKILRISQERKMGFSQERGQHAESQQKHQPRRVPEQDR